jgi:hypothetical protein
VDGQGQFKQREIAMGKKCREGDFTYTFTLTNNTFSVASMWGQAFSIPVPADGVVKQTYRGTSTRSEHLMFELRGNIKSRDFEIFGLDTGCYWKLTPTS